MSTTTLEDLVPYELVTEFKNDPLINEIFMHAAANSLTQVSALITAVSVLVKERNRLMAEIGQCEAVLPLVGVNHDFKQGYQDAYYGRKYSSVGVRYYDGYVQGRSIRLLLKDKV